MVTYQHTEPESGRLLFDSGSWCWPSLLSRLGRGAPSRAVLSPMLHNLTGTKSNSGQATPHWTVEPWVADSPAVTTVMMALCHGCCRKAGRCWGDGEALAAGEHQVSAKHSHVHSLHWSYDSEGHRGGLRQNWGSSMTLIKSCNCFYFSFLPAQPRSATVLQSRTQWGPLAAQQLSRHGLGHWDGVDLGLMPGNFWLLHVMGAAKNKKPKKQNQTEFQHRFDGFLTPTYADFLCPKSSLKK